MPITRKIIRVGHSRAVTLPSGWLDYHQKKLGREIKAVTMEIDNLITLAVDESVNRDAAKKPGEITVEE